MGKIFIYSLIGISVLTGGLIALYYGFNALVVFNLKPIQQIVATDVSITSDWTEITPESPMKVKKQIQRLFLIIDGYKFNDSDRKWEIKLADGTIVKPEIQILDEFGNVYNLHDGTRVGDTIGFSPEMDSERFNTFPADRIYTKIRIRSDNPFQCSKIIWSNKTLK